jgi:class 3 adenylate cyclase
MSSPPTPTFLFADLARFTALTESRRDDHVSEATA